MIFIQPNVQAEVLLWQTNLIIIKVAGGQESDLAGSFVIGDREGALGRGEFLGVGVSPKVVVQFVSIITRKRKQDLI